MTNVQQPTPQAVQGFGLQNQTIPSFQPDAVQGQITTLSQTTAQPTQYNNFMNTDVVQQWFLLPALSVTAPTGTTNVVSPYAPYSAIGNVQVNVQNQFQPINTNGIDLFVKNTIWPYREGSFWNSQTAAAAQTYPTPQTRLYGTDAETISTTAVTWSDLVPIGPAMHFDDYYHIDVSTGQTLAFGGSPSRRLWAGVQYMGGTNRAIWPTVNYNPLVATTSNNALYTVSGTQTAAGTGTATATFYRDLFYQYNPTALPAPTNWVPTFTTYPVTVGNQPVWTFQLPKALQILGVVFRFYDPGTAPGSIPAFSTI